MHDAERFRLRFGSYRTPHFKYGVRVKDARRGFVNTVGLSDAPIPWPIGAGVRGAKSLVLFGALVRAVRRESNQAVARAWGVTGQTVTAWRRALVVGPTTAGTSKLRLAHFREPWALEAQKKAWAKARDPQRRAKIAAARRGKPRPAHVIEVTRERYLEKTLLAETRRKMSEAHKRRRSWPPLAGRPWTPAEDELIRTLRIAEVAKRTGRTVSAVKNRQVKLGMPDERTMATREWRV